MATALRPIAHEDRLSLVEHLDELRTRIILCLAVFVAAFAFCFWQNDRILEIMDRPLEKSAFHKGSNDPLEKSATFQQAQKRYYLQFAALSRAMARSEDLSPALQAQWAELEPRGGRDRRRRPQGERPAPGHARRRRAVHGHVQGRRLRGAAAVAAVPALPGVRVRVTGVLAERAGGRAAADGDGAVPVHRAAWCSRTTWCCRTRSTSCRTSTTTTTTSCCRRGTTTGSRSWS